MGTLIKGVRGATKKEHPARAGQPAGTEGHRTPPGSTTHTSGFHTHKELPRQKPPEAVPIGVPFFLLCVAVSPGSSILEASAQRQGQKSLRAHCCGVGPGRALPRVVKLLSDSTCRPRQPSTPAPHSFWGQESSGFESSQRF